MIHNMHALALIHTVDFRDFGVEFQGRNQGEYTPKDERIEPEK